MKCFGYIILIGSVDGGFEQGKAIILLFRGVVIAINPPDFLQNSFLVAKGTNFFSSYFVSTRHFEDFHRCCGNKERLKIKVD